MTSATMSPKKPARSSDAASSPERGEAVRGEAAGVAEGARSLRDIAAANASLFVDSAKGIAADSKTPAEPSGTAEASKKPSPGARRRDARVWALQLAYARAVSDDPMDWIERHLRGTAMAEEAELEASGMLVVPQESDFEFAGKIARAAADGADRFDNILAGALKNWRVERLTLVDRLVLRIALAELESFRETPYRVVLNEYIEIAKCFGTPQSARFVNGVLDAAARVVRPEEGAKGAASSPAKKPAKKRDAAE